MGKDYSKYYTPISISNALVSLINFADNSTVIDICCGSGHLLSAAKMKNNTLECYGVDIADIASNESIDYIINDDGRSYALQHKCTFDYALANPPFGRCEKDDYADKIFSGPYASISSRRLEIEMLYANLHILNDTGVLLIIVPSTIVSGSSMINIRKDLAKKHYVSAIVDLPMNAFSPERIKTSALIIHKAPHPNHSTMFYTMHDSLEITEFRNIKYAEMILGNWSDIKEPINSDFTIHQGKIPSSSFSESGADILHTGKRSDKWQPSLRHAILPAGNNYIMAEDGDILISRVGASAGQKCIYHGDAKVISDCILIIKTPSTELQKNFSGLDLLPLVTGLSTPHITARSIYYLYYNTYERAL